MHHAPLLRDDLLPKLTAAMKLHVAGQIEKADEAYQQLLIDFPEHAEVLYAMSALYMQQQDYPKAEDVLARALISDPHTRKHYERLVKLHETMQKPEAVIDDHVRWLDTHPKDVQAVVDLFNLCMKEQRFSPALKCINALLAKDPNNIPVHGLAMLLYERTGDYQAKIPHMAAMLKADPDKGLNFYVDYMIALRNSGRTDEALDVCKQALKYHPNADILYSMIGGIFHMVKRWEESIDYFRMAQEKAEGRKEMRYNEGLTRLLISNMKEGYDDYELRLKSGKVNVIEFKESLPQWTGQPLKDKRLLIWVEQGIGDIFMFLTCLPWFIQQGARISIGSYPKLLPMLQRSFPDLDVFTIEYNIVDKEPEKKWDYHVPLGSIIGPALLGGYMPSEHPHLLKADPERASALREKYQKLRDWPKGVTPRLIGISWHTKNDDNSFVRNINLPQWKPLLEVPNVQWISLQYGDHRTAIRAVNSQMQTENLVYQDPEIDQYVDTDALAAQIAAMDEVINIQNANAHLAGSLGVPTTLLLSAASDWRWGKDRLDNCWYQSVRIIRQDVALHWEPVMQQMKAELLKRV